MEREKDEAWKIYVSDSLAFYSSVLTRGEEDVPRYSDIVKFKPQEPQETSDEIKAKFNSLRRKKE